MIEVDEQINAVQRRVGSRVLEAGEARTSTISQVYAAEIDDVWDACTNAERIPRWFLPISGDLRVHGRYQLEGNAGGTITECEPPNALRRDVGVRRHGQLDRGATDGGPDGGTRFELEHVAHVDDETLGAVRSRCHRSRLGPLPDGPRAASRVRGEPVDPKAFEEWSASADGKRFVTMSSDRWFEANVAAGADRDQARVAADRTTAAYTEAPHTS